MKLFNALIFISALAVLSFAQRAQNNTDEQLRKRNAPDVFVYNASAFGPDEKGDSHFTIEVGNTGSKTITAIEWEYRYSNEAEQRKVGVFRNVKLKLLPDRKIKLTQQVHHYTDTFVKSFNLGTVRLMQVEYEDGSAWTRLPDQR